MTYFPDEIKVGMIHDHIETYSVKFWFTKDGHRSTNTLTLYIEDGYTQSEIEKKLRKRFKEPEVVSVKLK